MLKYCLSALLCVAVGASAATVQLKEKASVTGTILADKHDQVIVDLGYTVLSIPRNQVVRVLNEDVAPEATTKSAKTSKTTTKPVVTTEKGYKTIFTTSATPLKERSVRELVNVLGESVVQVRTPGGLGSGFFINEDGYLITNFHVTEGETQISIEVYHSKKGELERHIYKNVRIVALNKFADLALLKIEEKDAKFVPVALGDSEPLAVGERVFAIGSPLGL